MEREAYIKQLEEDDFSPGWDAIDEAFKDVYGDQEPGHYATNMVARAIFGGDQYLDGSNLARYTFQSKSWFEPYDCVVGNGETIHIGHPSKITALVIVPDTEMKGRDTVHGRLDFLQLVGITENELQAIKGKNREERERFVKVMQQDNPDLITDMAREKEYLDF